MFEDLVKGGVGGATRGLDTTGAARSLGIALSWAAIEAKRFAISRRLSSEAVAGGD